MPLIAGAIGVVFVVLLVVFVVRSCTSGSTQGAQQGGEGATEVAAAQANAGTDIKLLMVGDILFHYQVRQSGLQSDGTRNYDHVFANFQSELADKDIKVVNQETPLGGAELKNFVGDAPDGYGSYPTFNGPQEMGDAEAKAGFNVILKATNHALDADYEGLSSELEFWEGEHPDVKVIGAVNPTSSTDSVDDVYVFEKDGFKVALLNYTFGLNGMPDSKGVMSMLEEEHIQDTMEEAQKKADMIVVFPHWGEEYETTPNAEQRAWAKLFVQEGADVIIGNHPHVMQPVEVFANEDGDPVPCFWSTGNFVSTSPEDKSLLGGVPELTLHKDADGNCSITSAEMKVVVTHLGLGDDMTVYPLSEWTDALASTNKLNTEMNPDTDNSTLTPAWAAEFCTEVLGSDYDTKTATLVVDLSDTTSLSSSSKDTQGDDSTSAGDESSSSSSSKGTSSSSTSDSESGSSSSSSSDKTSSSSSDSDEASGSSTTRSDSSAGSSKGTSSSSASDSDADDSAGSSSASSSDSTSSSDADSGSSSGSSSGSGSKTSSSNGTDK